MSIPEHTVLLSGKKFEITLERLCRQLIERHDDFKNTALIGLQPRGIYLAESLKNRLEIILDRKILYGKLDATFHRDDYRTHLNPILPSVMQIDFPIDGRRIVLVDDVLFTGRTIRSGLDALVDLGRPQTVELVVLVDRRYSRQLPIEPDYVGIAVDTRTSEKVKVFWKATEGENSVLLLPGHSNENDIAIV